jgi:putative methyltransferase
VECGVVRSAAKERRAHGGEERKCTSGRELVLRGLAGDGLTCCELTPTLALLLVHDLFLAKKGIALPATHGLSSSVRRHRVRLSAELTKARLRRGFGTLDALRKDIDAKAVTGSQPNGEQPMRHPRWIRVNTLKSSLDEELGTGAFSTFSQVGTLAEIVHAPRDSRRVHVDQHIPDLVAIASPEEPTTLKAYRTGALVLQEKASCFPAYLLGPTPEDGDVIDACAAPGNKTTHIAALVHNNNTTRRIFACERDPERSKTLLKMTKLAGADQIVTVKSKQDFTRLDVNKQEFANVTGLILDPSCSGSGIFGRDEGTLIVHLPSAEDDAPPKGKKRKRGGSNNNGNKPLKSQTAQQDQKFQDMEIERENPIIVEETPENEAENDSQEKLHKRLENLSAFQLRIVKHAMAFPAARKITYSTCSVHEAENENVVVGALLSDVAVQRGWRVLRREEQVDGMKRWHKRGGVGAVRSAVAAIAGVGAELEVEAVAEACIRCDKGGEDGTMGFFVVGLVRDDAGGALSGADSPAEASGHDEDEDEWEGFSGADG